MYETIDYRSTIFCIHLCFAFGVSTSLITRNLCEDSVVSGKYMWSSLSQVEHFISLTKVIDSGAVSNLCWLRVSLKTFARNTKTKILFFLLNVNKEAFSSDVAGIHLGKKSLGKKSIETEGNWALTDIIKPINQALPEASAISSLFNYVSH